MCVGLGCSAAGRGGFVLAAERLHLVVEGPAPDLLQRRCKRTRNAVESVDEPWKYVADFLANGEGMRPPPVLVVSEIH